jgi:hypothetical protein
MAKKKAAKKAPARAAKKAVVAKKAVKQKVVGESVKHPSSGAPAKIPVKKLGARLQGKCALAHPGCKANPVGLVQAYRNKNTSLQVDACDHCHRQMILSGQWVDTP